MKTRIIKSIFALVLAFVALPIAANDYLKIYFKDGHTERHYMKLVDNISVTKYDLEGNLHSDYQMQQIVMADTTYSYYLSDIESMAFAKVEEDELEKNVESVENNVTPIFEQCSTVEEMEARLDEIKAIASVEDAWRDGSDIVVQVRDWHKVFYKFPLVPENYDNLVAGFAKSLKKNKQLLARKADGTMLKVAIAFQMTDDSRFDDEEEGLLELRNKFAKMGFDAHFIPDEKTGETLDVDFYRRRIFDYDIVFLATHGKYSDGKHYFFTSKKTSLKEDVIMETIDAVTDLDDISVGFCNTGKYLVNFGTFVIVSEDYIKKSGYRFKGSGPHIVFNAACQSLYGGDVLSREHNGVKESYYGSDAVAKVFFDKGADLYIGATNLTYNARLAGISFFHYMLDGASEDCAFNLLEPKYKYEEKSKHKSALVDLYNPKSKFGNLKSLFLNDVQTEEKDNQDINKEYKENGHVVLEGKVSPLYEKNSGLSFGFRLASESGVDELDSYETLPSNNADYSGLDPWEIVFSSTYTPEQGKTYYYRAYIYDGSHYNWGEERNFTIEAAPVYPDLVLSQTQLSIVDGNSTTVEITSGSGEYGVTNLNSSIARGTLQGTTVTIDGVAVGNDAKIVVTDMQTGQQIIITVSVTASSGTETPGEAVDLGLPSGLKWANMNVGAESPEDYGDYFTWGEVTPQSDNAYSWESYKWSNGNDRSITKYCTRSDYGNDGFTDTKTVLDAEDDAAHVNWGGDWRMPTLADFQELIDNTTSEWTTQNGVKGRKFTSKTNSNSIFLPAAGYRWNGELNFAGSHGGYWSSTLYEGRPDYTQYLYFDSGVVRTSNNHRGNGRSVRPVRQN
jgi:hypothetical protein